MVTGHEDSDAIRRAFEAGATDFISKPVNWALLPRRLEYILRNAAAAEHIERLAYYDTLTGLPNRQRCMDLPGGCSPPRGLGRSRGRHLPRSEQLQARQRHVRPRDGRRGVARLRGPAARDVVDFRRRRPERLVIARFGGDEFVVVLRHAQARAVGMQIAGGVHDAFSEPITHDALEFYSAPSIGMAVFPDDGADVATVFKHADTAMYQAKSGATGSRRRLRARHEQPPARLAGARSSAAPRGQNDLLTWCSSPSSGSREHRLVGVEALLRWRDDEYR